MKERKNSGVRSGAYLATSVVTMFGFLSVNVATAQSDAINIDVEACQSLNDSTALDTESIKTRIACYSRDVEHLNQLVNQLMDEREQLITQSEDNLAKDATIDGYKKELEQRQSAMQRLEERAVTLSLQIDEITADRNQMREQLYNLMSEGKDRAIEVEANERLFESFSQSYVTLSAEIEALRNKLKEFEDQNSELSNQRLAQLEHTEKLSSQIATLEQTVSTLKQDNAQLETDVAAANQQLASMKSQMQDNAAIADDRNTQIAELKNSLDNSEQDRLKLQADIDTLNQNHLAAIGSLNDQSTKLTDEILSLQIREMEIQGQSKEQIAEITALKNSLTESENNKLNLQKEIDTLIQNHLASISSLNEQSTKLSDEILSLQASEKELQGQAKEQVSRIVELQNALAYSKQSRLKLQTEIESLNQNHLASVNTLNDQSTKLSDEILSLQLREQELQQQAQTASEEMQAAVSTRDAEIAELSQARQKLNAEREQLIAQVASLEKTYLEKTQGYQDQASTLEARITVLVDEKSELSEQVNNQTSANEELKEYARQSNEKSADLNVLANTLRGQLDDANAATSELQASLESLGKQSDEQTAEFTEKLATLNSTIEESQQERDVLASELETVLPKLQTAELDLISSNEKNEALTSDVKALELQLNKATEQQATLRASLEATETKSRLTSEKLASLKGNSETLKSLLNMSRVHSKNAEATLTELRTEMNASENRLRAKQDELQNLLAEKKRIENNFKALASQSQSQADSIQKALLDAGHENVKVAVSEDNVIGVLLGSGQLFKTGSARLSSEGKKVLTDLANTFSTVEDRRIMISGHSDNVPLGAKLGAIFKDNWGLSMARALATANFFTEEAEVAAERMTVSGFGATKPVANNDTEEGRQQNRRVEIQLTPLDQQVASVK